jgi:hypothetical protein
MKKCGKCKIEKNEIDFGKDKQRNDGLNVYCKECIRQRNREYKEKNPEKILFWSSQNRKRHRDEIIEWHRTYYAENKDKILRRERESYLKRKDEIAIRRAKERRQPEFKEKNRQRLAIWRKKNPEKARQSVRNWQIKHRERHAAHQAVHRAIEMGMLIRSPTCEKCGKICKTDGHHTDYNKRLEVVWLCRQCHQKIIRKIEV